MPEENAVHETIKAASSYYTLARLISPVSVEEFKNQYYEREPLLIQRGDREYYRDLFTLADLDRALMVTNLRADSIRVVVDGEETPISKLLASSDDERLRGNELELIYQRFREGSTIVANAINERHEGLMRLCRSLDNDENFNPQLNIYLTPPESRGFRPHYDTHDVMIVQVHGSKRWNLYGAAAELPLRNQTWRTPEEGPGDPTHEFTLESGDLLYLPRGTVHAGTSTHEASMHVTIGIHPVLWADVFKKAIRSVVENDIAFRRALPIGFTHDGDARAAAEGLAKQLAAALLDQLPTPERMVSSSVWDRVVDQRHPELRGHLVDLQMGQITADSLIRRRPEVQALLGRDGDAVTLSFHGKSVRFPARVSPELRDVVERDGRPFKPSQIAGNLDESGRSVLVAILLKEGFLTAA
ncbi:cupin domain-containing protein [Actinomadura rupiterrae]|uniref:cupin domain-containing protein n=1 Tax=Actinomadura rupiterrae TaxID=559627 RepID=UPI0020A57B86|nr:cupin domain-containing protein [Actinomadura rupiterrae]MCP2343178.1 ribosomal protein L16 Arg81 hydroxylase [Actinomadura rupiterrae]